jgi:hypothetical protein
MRINKQKTSNAAEEAATPGPGIPQRWFPEKLRPLETAVGNLPLEGISAGKWSSQ